MSTDERIRALEAQVEYLTMSFRAGKPDLMMRASVALEQVRAARREALTPEGDRLLARAIETLESIR